MVCVKGVPRRAWPYKPARWPPNHARPASLVQMLPSRELLAVPKPLWSSCRSALRRWSASVPGWARHAAVLARDGATVSLRLVACVTATSGPSMDDAWWHGCRRSHINLSDPGPSQVIAPIQCLPLTTRGRLAIRKKFLLSYLLHPTLNLDLDLPTSWPPQAS